IGQTIDKRSAYTFVNRETHGVDDFTLYTLSLGELNDLFHAQFKDLWIFTFSKAQFTGHSFKNRASGSIGKDSDFGFNEHAGLKVLFRAAFFIKTTISGLHTH